MKYKIKKSRKAWKALIRAKIRYDKWKVIYFLKIKKFSGNMYLYTLTVITYMEGEGFILFKRYEISYMFISNILFFLGSVIIIITLLLQVAYAILFERKLLGSIQRRRGPNTVGLLGLLQPISDALKLILKEIIIPASANKNLFIFSAGIGLTLSCVNWAIIPWQNSAKYADVSISVLFFFAISGLSVYGIIISGWSSNSKYAFLGALRAAAQVIAYEICIGLTLIFILMISKSLNYNEIIIQQRYLYNFIHSFNFCNLFFIASLAETNRPPFDLPEAEAELVSGYNVEYSGMSFGYFFLSEYVAIWTVSALNVILFWGGYNVLFSLNGWIIVFAWKTITLVGFFIWVRGSVPRYRYDQLMRLGWKILLPITLGAFLFSISVYYYNIQKESINLLLTLYCENNIDNGNNNNNEINTNIENNNNDNSNSNNNSKKKLTLKQIYELIGDHVHPLLAVNMEYLLDQNISIEHIKVINEIALQDDNIHPYISRNLEYLSTFATTAEILVFNEMMVNPEPEVEALIEEILSAQKELEDAHSAPKAQIMHIIDVKKSSNVTQREQKDPNAIKAVGPLLFSKLRKKKNNKLMVIKKKHLIPLVPRITGERVLKKEIQRFIWKRRKEVNKKIRILRIEYKKKEIEEITWDLIFKDNWDFIIALQLKNQIEPHAFKINADFVKLTFFLTKIKDYYIPEKKKLNKEEMLWQKLQQSVDIEKDAYEHWLNQINIDFLKWEEDFYIKAKTLYKNICIEQKKIIWKKKKLNIKQKNWLINKWYIKRNNAFLKQQKYLLKSLINITIDEEILTFTKLITIKNNLNKINLYCYIRFWDIILLKNVKKKLWDNQYNIKKQLELNCEQNVEININSHLKIDEKLLELNIIKNYTVPLELEILGTVDVSLIYQCIKKKGYDLRLDEIEKYPTGWSTAKIDSVFVITKKIIIWYIEEIKIKKKQKTRKKKIHKKKKNKLISLNINIKDIKLIFSKEENLFKIWKQKILIEEKLNNYLTKEIWIKYRLLKYKNWEKKTKIWEALNEEIKKEDDKEKEKLEVYIDSVKAWKWNRYLYFKTKTRIKKLIILYDILDHQKEYIHYIKTKISRMIKRFMSKEKEIKQEMEKSDLNYKVFEKEIKEKLKLKKEPEELIEYFAYLRNREKRKTEEEKVEIKQELVYFQNSNQFNIKTWNKFMREGVPSWIKEEDEKEKEKKKEYKKKQWKEEKEWKKKKELKEKKKELRKIEKEIAEKQRELEEYEEQQEKGELLNLEEEKKKKEKKKELEKKQKQRELAEYQKQQEKEKKKEEKKKKKKEKRKEREKETIEEKKARKKEEKKEKKEKERNRKIYIEYRIRLFSIVREKYDEDNKIFWDYVKVKHWLLMTKYMVIKKKLKKDMLYIRLTVKIRAKKWKKHFIYIKYNIIMFFIYKYFLHAVFIFYLREKRKTKKKNQEWTLKMYKILKREQSFWLKLQKLNKLYNELIKIHVKLQETNKRKSFEKYLSLKKLKDAYIINIDNTFKNFLKKKWILWFSWTLEDYDIKEWDKYKRAITIRWKGLKENWLELRDLGFKYWKAYVYMLFKMFITQWFSNIFERMLRMELKLKLSNGSLFYYWEQLYMIIFFEIEKKIFINSDLNLKEERKKKKRKEFKRKKIDPNIALIFGLRYKIIKKNWKEKWRKNLKKEEKRKKAAELKKIIEKRQIRPHESYFFNSYMFDIQKKAHFFFEKNVKKKRKKIKQIEILKDWKKKKRKKIKRWKKNIKLLNILLIQWVYKNKKKKIWKKQKIVWKKQILKWQYYKYIIYKKIKKKKKINNIKIIKINIIKNKWKKKIKILKNLIKLKYKFIIYNYKYIKQNKQIYNILYIYYFTLHDSWYDRENKIIRDKARIIWSYFKYRQEEIDDYQLRF